MALHRSDNPPPYEIMRHGWSESPQQIRDLTKSRSGDSQSLAPITSKNLVLRLPRGYAVLAGICLVVLLILAYWVGRSRGYTAAMRSVQDREAADMALLADPRPNPVGVPGVRVTDGQRRGQRTGLTLSRVVQNAQQDPRTPGLNYLMLARYPAQTDDALRLVDFLVSREVEAIAVLTDNGRFYHVVAMKGFTANQVSDNPASAYQQYKQRLKALGREWKQKLNGPNDLSDLYAMKYQGPKN